MDNKNRMRSWITVITTFAIIFVYSNVALARSKNYAGIAIRGNVTVNGEPAVNSETITSGSIITTGLGGKAVISLGGEGKVRLNPNTTVTVDYSTDRIFVKLKNGGVRLMTGKNTSASVVSRGATFDGGFGRVSSFAVQAYCSTDEKCFGASVTTFEGVVTMKRRGDKTVKKITTDMGTVSSSFSALCEKGCAEAPLPTAKKRAFKNNKGLIYVLIAGVAAAVIAVFALSNDNEDDNDQDLDGDDNNPSDIT